MKAARSRSAPNWPDVRRPDLKWPDPKWLGRTSGPALVGTALVACVLAGCTTQAKVSASQPSEASAKDPLVGCQVTDEAGIDDVGLNAQVQAALAELHKTHNLKPLTVESATAADVVPNVASLLAQDCAVLIGSGATTRDAVQAAAQRDPKLKVLVVGAPLTGADGTPGLLPNGQSVQFDAGQAGYLAGYLAAGASTSGKVAVLGGAQVPGTTAVMDGFADGVAAYNAANANAGNAKPVAVLGWDKATQAGTFAGNNTNETAGKAAAKSLIDQGADVVLPVGGPFGIGAAQAAKDKPGTRVIWIGEDGSTADGLPGLGGVVLASVVEDAQAPVVAALTRIEQGQFSNTPYVGTVKNGGITLVPGKDLGSSISPALSKQVAAVTKQLKDGNSQATPPANPQPTPQPTP